MGDAAEKWLVENDPDYLANAANWKHLQQSGTYRRPRQEIPWGLADDLELLVEGGERTSYVGEGSDRREPRARGYVGEVGRRICERCGEMFVPKAARHKFCSHACRQSVWDRKKRRERKTLTQTS